MEYTAVTLSGLSVRVVEQTDDQYHYDQKG